MTDRGKACNKILITGSSGLIGTVLSSHLISSGYFVRGFDRRESDLADFVQGDLVDTFTLSKALAGIDVVIHLAASGNKCDFQTELIPDNMIGVKNLFEQASLEGVNKVIFASSIEAANTSPESSLSSVDERHAMNHYGLLKLWAEDFAEMYSRCHRMNTIVMRLGWYLRSQQELEILTSTPGAEKLYLSENDMLSSFICCLEASTATAKNFTRVYALSKNLEQPLFDMETSRIKIAFEPCDVFPQGLPQW